MDLLCDNTLEHVVSFLDFASAVKLTRTTSRALTSRVGNGRSYLWKEIYDRHCFSPAERDDAKGTLDYVEECQKRRRMFHNLLGRRRNRPGTCFNLPNRYFYFVPVVPPEDDDWDVAPPVDFDCRSFLLTGGGTSGEMVFLDPFDGSVVIQASCLDNAVMSDEAMMEQAMTDAATLIKAKDKLGLQDVAEQYIAGAVIEESVFRNHNMEHYQQGPKQVLMDLNDYFDINLSEYFHLTNQPARAEDALGENEEVDIDFFGIEAKQIIVSGEVRGTMVAVGRTLSTDPEDFSSPKVCAEMIIWKRVKGGQFDQRLVCRVRSSYKSMEIDPVFHRVYVSFPFSEGPFRQLDAHARDAQADHLSFQGGSCVIAAYPMEAYPENGEKDTHHECPQHFPKALFILKCSHPVSTMTVMPCGKTVLTGTTKGTVEIWETGELGGARRTAVIDVKAALGKVLKKSSASLVVERGSVGVEDPTGADETTADANGPPMSDDSDINDNADQRVENEEDIENAMSPVATSFHVSDHQSIDQNGFVTLHHVHRQGSSLLLWRREKGGAFEIVSSITLPLSSRRKPRIYYDGRRLVVCGQDHIGMIILVYRTLNTWEDVGHFTETIGKPGQGKGDELAGIINLTKPHRVKYGNRIRHAALGGLEYYDSMYMTANERFLVINTKAGNLFGGGSSPRTDGLLVIDLEEHA